MSYQAITDIITAQKTSELQLSATVKDSPNQVSTSFADFLASYNRKEVSSDDNKSTEPVKKEVKKTESVKKSEPVKKEKNSEVQHAKAKVQNVSPDAPVFKIQIMAGHSDLSVTSSHFKGIGGIEKIKEGDFYRYYVGASNDYNAVNRRRKELSEVFPGCYIVAFKHGKLVNVNEAIKEFLKSRNKK